MRAVDLGEEGDHGGVDGIGLFQPAHALGELPDRAGVEDGDRQGMFGEQREGLPFVAAGGLHRDHLNLLGVAEGRQFGDAAGVVGKASRRAGAADRGVQPAGANIDSTNDTSHGNLPCTCD